MQSHRALIHPRLLSDLNARRGVNISRLLTTDERARRRPRYTCRCPGIWSLAVHTPNKAPRHQTRPDQEPWAAGLLQTRARRPEAPRSMKPPRAAKRLRRRTAGSPGPTLSPLRRYDKTQYACSRTPRNNLRIHHRPGSENRRGRRRRQRDAGKDDHDLRASARRNRRGPRKYRGPPGSGRRSARGWRRRRRSIEAGARKHRTPKNPMYTFLIPPRTNL